MGRYLFRIAYLGTKFSGVQLNCKPTEVLKTDKSIPAELLRCLYSPELKLDQKAFKVHATSRTDQGVHALNNLINIDLEPRGNRNIHVGGLRKLINSRLKKRNHMLRVLDIQRVSDNMNLHRCVKYRRYVYRLAVLRTPTVVSEPIHEIHLSKWVRTPFDVDKFLETAAVFSGQHDFTVFTTQSYFQRPENENKSSIRTVEIGVKRGNMIFEDLDLSKPDDFEIFEIHIKSRGFMYRQIRRMVYSMIDVANGKFTVEEIRKYLHEPSSYDVNNVGRLIQTLGADGLYLVEVKCDPEDMQYDGESNGDEEDDEEDYEDIDDITDTEQTVNKDKERTKPVENDSGVLQNILQKFTKLKVQ